MSAPASANQSTGKVLSWKCGGLLGSQVRGQGYLLRGFAFRRAGGNPKIEGCADTEGEDTEGVPQQGIDVCRDSWGEDIT